ncbi:MAG: LacI family DNA-binding transcriptional regulator [Lachnospiraceae bacterium]|nr:LacI family DNA-binding transcriptional regulator [Lachnospiraceae bacterium]
MAPVTIKDIAKRCGVGVSTVSRALNNHPDINPETKAKIMEVIHETGFVPNDSARYLKRTETNAIALVVKGISNPFFTSMIRIMEDYVQKKSYATILRHVTAEENEVTVALSLIKERKLKGIVFLGGDFTHDPMLLSQIRVPYVFSTIGNLDERPEGEAACANIAVDDVEASRQAVDYLIGLGHRRIGIVAEGLHVPSVGQLRYRGYRLALERRGITVDDHLVYEITEGGERYSMKNGYIAAKALLAANPDMTAVFCISDVLAIGACRAIAESGQSIPGDVSVIGFDGIEEGQYYIPKLTTVRQPVEEMSKESIRLLFDMIEKKEKPRNIIMPAQLLIGESSGPVKKT